MDVSARTAVLLALDRPAFGDEIATCLVRRSRGRMRLLPGNLYPTLHRLEREGLVRSWTERAGRGRPRRHYELTVAGVAEANKVREGLAALLGRSAQPVSALTPDQMAAGFRQCEAVSLFARAIGELS